MYRNQGRTGCLERGDAGEARQILGTEDPDMLRSMNNLALIYWDQVWAAQAVALQEECAGGSSFEIG